MGVILLFLGGGVVLSYTESNIEVRSRNCFNPLKHGDTRKYVYSRIEHFTRPCNGSDSHQLLTQKAWVLSQSNQRGFVVNNVAVGQVCLRVLEFSHRVSFHQYSMLIIRRIPTPVATNSVVK